MRRTFRLTLFVGAVCGLALLLRGRLTVAQGGIGSHSPRWCHQCHPEAYERWASSGHGAAFDREVFQAVWERERQAEACLSCHTTAYDPEVGVAAYEGVACAACHAPVGEDEYDPETRDHVELSVPVRVEDCAACHGTDHALTYVEWEWSGHNGSREVGCLSCHDPHSAGLVEDDITALCGSCHFQPVPVASPHMFVESGCTDCHPAPVSTDNVHMHGSDGAIADCLECHMVTQTDRWGRYLTNAGHTMEVSLAACVNCHGELHAMQPGEVSPETESVSVSERASSEQQPIAPP